MQLGREGGCVHTVHANIRASSGEKGRKGRWGDSRGWEKGSGGGITLGGRPRATDPHNAALLQGPAPSARPTRLGRWSERAVCRPLAWANQGLGGDAC